MRSGSRRASAAAIPDLTTRQRVKAVGVSYRAKWGCAADPANAPTQRSVTRAASRAGRATDQAGVRAGRFRLGCTVRGEQGAQMLAPADLNAAIAQVRTGKAYRQHGNQKREGNADRQVGIVVHAEPLEGLVRGVLDEAVDQIERVGDFAEPNEGRHVDRARHIPGVAD